MKPVAVRMKKRTNSHSYSLVRGELFDQLLLQADSWLARRTPLSAGVQAFERRGASF
jgi:hypothetical protein